MEQVRTIVAYHVSKPDGGWCYIWRNAPFLSQKKRHSDPAKWLTDGYYFWTDSTHFARHWGQTAYDNSYAISQCTVAVPEKELLDLVGDVEDQLFFRELFDRLKRIYEKEKRPLKYVTVPDVIDWAREKKLLPHAAIKASDCPKGSINAPFKVESGTKAKTNWRAERLMLPTRQQLCVFQGYEEYFETVTVIYPEEFRLAVENVFELRGRGCDEERKKRRTAQ